MSNESTSGQKEEQAEIDEEYARISENEMIYLDEVSFWDTSQKIVKYISAFSFIAIILPLFFLPPNTPINLESFQNYPLQVLSIWIGMVLLIISIVARPLLLNKVSRIKKELGLHREETLYLRAYEAYKDIDSYLNESNPKRRLYFKKSAIGRAKELTESVEGWNYGNIRLIIKLVGDKIDLLKDNMRRLILSNIATGDEETLKKISKILVELCKYIHKPSLERLGRLNDMIKEIPFKEYKYLTRKERMSGYFYSKPRVFRLIFAFSVTATVVAVLLCLEQSLGLAIAVGVTCFWGSFAGFDKLFRIKEK